MPSESFGAVTDDAQCWGHVLYAEAIVCASAAAAGNASACQSRQLGVPGEFLDNFVEILILYYQVPYGLVGVFAMPAQQLMT